MIIKNTQNNLNLIYDNFIQSIVETFISNITKMNTALADNGICKLCHIVKKNVILF